MFKTNKQLHVFAYIFNTNNLIMHKNREEQCNKIINCKNVSINTQTINDPIANASCLKQHEYLLELQQFIIDYYISILHYFTKNVLHTFIQQKQLHYPGNDPVMYMYSLNSIPLRQ